MQKFADINTQFEIVTPCKNLNTTDIPKEAGNMFPTAQKAYKLKEMGFNWLNTKGFNAYLTSLSSYNLPNEVAVKLIEKDTPSMYKRRSKDVTYSIDEGCEYRNLLMQNHLSEIHFEAGEIKRSSDGKIDASYECEMRSQNADYKHRFKRMILDSSRDELEKIKTPIRTTQKIIADMFVQKHDMMYYTLITEENVDTYPGICPPNIIDSAIKHKDMFDDLVVIEPTVIPYKFDQVKTSRPLIDDPILCGKVKGLDDVYFLIDYRYEDIDLFGSSTHKKNNTQKIVGF